MVKSPGAPKGEAELFWDSLPCARCDLEGQDESYTVRTGLVADSTNLALFERPQCVALRDENHDAEERDKPYIRLEVEFLAGCKDFPGRRQGAQRAGSSEASQQNCCTRKHMGQVP